MSEDHERSTIDKEEQLRTFRALLNETPKKPNLPKMTPDKKKLIEKILNLRIVKADYTLSKAKRIDAENESFLCFEQLLKLLDGDVDTLKRLLGERHPHRVKEGSEVLEP